MDILFVLDRGFYDIPVTGQPFAVFDNAPESIVAINAAESIRPGNSRIGRIVIRIQLVPELVIIEPGLYILSAADTRIGKKIHTLFVPVWPLPVTRTLVLTVERIRSGIDRHTLLTMLIDITDRVFRMSIGRIADFYVDLVVTAPGIVAAAALFIFCRNKAFRQSKGVPVETGNTVLDLILTQLVANADVRSLTAPDPPGCSADLERPHRLTADQVDGAPHRIGAV